jgi:hypothetical protein
MGFGARAQKRSAANLPDVTRGPSTAVAAVPTGDHRRAGCSLTHHTASAASKVGVTVTDADRPSEETS